MAIEHDIIMAVSLNDRSEIHLTNYENGFKWIFSIFFFNLTIFNYDHLKLQENIKLKQPI